MSSTEIVHERVVHEHEFHALDAPPHIQAGRQSCMVKLQGVQFDSRDSENLLQGMEECKNATGEASFDAKARHKSRTGVRGCRLDVFTGGGCIRGGRADHGYAADAEFFT